jgi:hypothetical protein
VQCQATPLQYLMTIYGGISDIHDNMQHTRKVLMVMACMRISSLLPVGLSSAVIALSVSIPGLVVAQLFPCLYSMTCSLYALLSTRPVSSSSRWVLGACPSRKSAVWGDELVPSSARVSDSVFSCTRCFSSSSGRWLLWGPSRLRGSQLLARVCILQTCNSHYRPPRSVSEASRVIACGACQPAGCHQIHPALVAGPLGRALKVS